MQRGEPLRRTDKLCVMRYAKPEARIVSREIHVNTQIGISALLIGVCWPMAARIRYRRHAQSARDPVSISHNSQHSHHCITISHRGEERITEQAFYTTFTTVITPMRHVGFTWWPPSPA